MVTIVQAESERDLQGILELQRKNLAAQLSPAEAREQGFVTVMHSYEQLLSLNSRERHVIAREGERVVGYILAMTEASRWEIPVLIPMFGLFDQLQHGSKSLGEQKYLVVGQVCIDQPYRGQGILDQCYAAYRAYYSTRYSLAITEIATANTRSLKAHQRIGFKNIHRYTAPDGVSWEIVAWDW